MVKSGKTLHTPLHGDMRQIYEYMEKQTPTISNALRVQDCIRVGAFLLAMKQKGEAVPVTVDGKTEDLLDHIGAFWQHTNG